ncbi:MAG TPA: ABC-2 family transporter protein [Roseiflexaceae bacterium]|nr:ABC-2 family transporter protein [Roseiflexaceae bacterium]
MIRPLLLNLRRYWHFSMVVPKQLLTYRARFWLDLFIQLLSLTIFLSFWRTVYADRAVLSGVTLQQLVNYLLLTQIFLRCLQGGNQIILTFGRLMAEGALSIELVRPIDFQLGMFAQMLASVATDLLFKIPLLLIAVTVFGLDIAVGPLQCAICLLLLLLGMVALFLFDWLLACLVLYTTEAWGLGLVRYAVAAFFGGVFVPIKLMPEWLATIAINMPFSQALYVPISFLVGFAPLDQTWQSLLIQLAWIVVLLPLSRLMFRAGLKRAVIQGG